jgi:hypothetical protein
MKRVSLLFRITSTVVFLQLLLGGLLTFNFITPLVHIVTGLAVLILAIVTMALVLVSGPPLWTLRWISISLVVLILVQAVLGFDTLDTGNQIVAWLHFVTALAIYGLVVAGTFMANRPVLIAVPSKSVSQKSKPTSVGVLAVVEILTGAIFTFGGTILLLSSPSGALLTFATFHIPIAVAFLIVGAASLAGKRWAWIMGVAVAVISIVDDVVALVVVSLPFYGEIGTSVVLVTALIAVYYLARSDVRTFFGRSSSVA